MNVNALHQLFLSHPIVCTDTRKITKDCLFFALKGPNFNANTFAAEALEKGAAYAIIDEAAFKNGEQTLLVNDVLQTLQELATFHRNHCKARVISLTGSNGKTTTKELIHAVLSKKYKTVATKGNLNNHIGVPLTLLSIQEDTEIAIVEMGANHQGEIAFLSAIAQPDFGYITNFGKAHLEGFGGVEGVVKGKSELYTYLLANNKHVFLNADDPLQLEKLAHYIKKIGFSQKDPRYYPISFLGAEPFVKLGFEGQEVTTKLVGAYNFTNCAIALLMGKYFNVNSDATIKAVAQYTPENNRSQLIEKSGHHIILDAYNANPTSMEAALHSFHKTKAPSKILFLGDMFELGDSAKEEHQKIAEMALEMDFDAVFLVGENFNATTTEAPKFKTFADLKTHLSDLRLKPSSILIKGSRGMALERLLDEL